MLDTRFSKNIRDELGGQVGKSCIEDPVSSIGWVGVIPTYNLNVTYRHPEFQP